MAAEGILRLMAMALTLCTIVELSVSGRPRREWRDYGGSPDSSRFVAATQISASNVQQLEVAWAYEAGATDFNPIVARGGEMWDFVTGLR